MLDWLKREQQPPADLSSGLRELLFGDVPLAAWVGRGSGEPWDRFRAASDAIQRGDPIAAEQALDVIVAMPGLEARHYAQAWTSLRELGVTPPDDQAKRVFGVIMDVPMNGGRDTLAAYEDGSARYLNHSGAMIVWEARGSDAQIGARVDALLDAGRNLVRAIGPWNGPRPPLRHDHARISLLTPSGLHFGEAPLDTLANDPMGAPLFAAATALVQALTARASAERHGTT